MFVQNNVNVLQYITTLYDSIKISNHFNIIQKQESGYCEHSITKAVWGKSAVNESGNL